MLEILNPASTNHLTTLARVKTELKITTSDQDGQLLDYISEASDMIAAYCNRDTFGQETLRQTERLSSARECIVLARDLAATIAAVEVSGEELGPDGYELDGSLLYRLCGDHRGWWTAGKVVVTYTAGYALLGALPFAIERAALDLIVNLHHAQGRDGAVRQEMVEGVGSQSFFDVRGSMKDSALPLSADRIAQLHRYRSIFVA